MTDPADSPASGSTNVDLDEATSNGERAEDRASTAAAEDRATGERAEDRAAGERAEASDAAAEAPVAEAPVAADQAAASATSSDAPGGDVSPEATTSEASGEAVEGEAAEGEGEGKKKRRRRRRKKKKGGAEGEAQAEEGAQAEPARKGKEPHLPFQKLFDGVARRHAFSVGEIVAGRISEAREDVAVVDLFGKALAYARLQEPREIPVAPVAEEDAGTTAAAVEGEAAAPSEAAASEAAATDAAPSEAAATEAAAPSEAAATEAAPSEAAATEAAPSEGAAPSEAAATEAAPSEAAATEAAPSEAAAPEGAPSEAAATEGAPAEAVASDASEADASASEEPQDGDPALLEGIPGEGALPREAPSEGPEPEAASTPREPVPEPAYVVAPEGVPPLEAGGIFRGRVGAVAESGHIAIVNELVDVKSTRAFLRQARDSRARVPGLVFGFNRGGFDVLVYGLRAFCPVSGLTLDAVDDPSTLLGQWGQFHVQAAKSGVQGLVVSRRSILEKEARKRAKAFLKSLEPGQTVRGRVTQVREFGLFVDIGGVEGLLHQSELSWERGVRPSDVAEVGDEIDVQVLNVHERESKRERHDRISLSMKALKPDPWRTEVEQLAEGQPRKGKIVRTAEFGAFVQLAPGVDGLLHITELGRELKHADQAVQVGDEIHVVVERIDRKQRRISLSKLSPEDAEAFEKGELTMESAGPRLKMGAAIKVRVTQVAPVGLHVQVDNVVGKRGRGFIPNAEMGTARGTDHRRQWPPGTEIDVIVIGTDRDGGMRCSRKRFLQDEERRAVREYRKEVSKQGLGTFGDILRQKLGTGQEGTQ